MAAECALPCCSSKAFIATSALLSEDSRGTLKGDKEELVLDGACGVPDAKDSTLIGFAEARAGEAVLAQ